MNDNVLTFPNARKSPEPVRLLVTIAGETVLETVENSDNVLLGFDDDQLDRVARAVMKAGLLLTKLREMAGRS
ncbi:hypothetical protein [Microvirga sp. Mcv34]|uniref:hypothetical protein n=1 Tax=Microvirga sp. Mcv34 TaxID=2926016 RepID=UPI0021CA324D|nr:hypothetical protein [Microvirga sp. Mcv34]